MNELCESLSVPTRSVNALIGNKLASNCVFERESELNRRFRDGLGKLFTERTTPSRLDLFVCSCQPSALLIPGRIF